MPEDRVSQSELIHRLGQTVGAAKAQAAVASAAQALGITEPTLAPEQCLKLLDHLGAGSDIVGIAARLLRAQVVLTSGLPRGGTPVPR